ncbi:hypothetical protein BDN72DRAFT_890675 [Pluteus cervinus]|uniref:Uncharacterized protein n=1 Tax=Pluteus cervinus TaxID=181527 RepID=A0ACD3BFR8_9AGAR|nr:hypothetical protein BDN72DRAFT_890675 [Pluteus cervinus]
MSSSQDFVRALRTGSDPPVQGGPTKIELAKQTWDDATFYVPEKAKVIAEWILSTFAKEKSAESTSNPLLDARYWQLLLDVISNQPSSSSRALPTWLITVLNRLPVAPIVSFTLTHQKTLPLDEQQSLLNAFTSCISLIWRIPAAKMTAEVLLDCLDAFWVVYLEGHKKRHLVASLGLLIAGSYRHAFVNSSNKKKLYVAFMHTHLSHWILATLSVKPCGDTLHECLCELGLETIFSIDMLRSSTEFGEDGAFFQIIQGLECVEAVQQSLPPLLHYFIHAIRKHRSPLFGQSSQGAGAAHEEHLAGIQFLNAVIKLTIRSPDSSCVWTTRRSLLEVVEDTNLLGRKSDEAADVVQSILSQALQDIDRNAIGSEIGDVAQECITILARIDFNSVLPVFPHLVSSLLVASCASPATTSFQDLAIDYSSKTRTINVYITTLFSALRTQQFLIDRYDHEALERIYATTISGPVVQSAHLRTLAGAISTFITAGQVIDMLKAIRQHFDDLWSALQEFSKSKKSKGDQQQPPQTSLNSTTLALCLSTTLASVILASLPYQTASEVTKQEVLNELSALREFVTNSLNKALKTARKADSWSNQIICTSLLRLQYAMETSIPIIPPPEPNSKLVGKLLELQSGELLPDLTLEIFRALLLYCSTSGEQEYTLGIIDAALSYLETHTHSSGITWSGLTQAIPSPRDGLAISAVALFYLICERWLHVIEIHASDVQLERFIRLFMQGTLHLAGSPTVGVDAATVVAKALHTASFWEYHRLRATFSAYINQATLVLEQLGSQQAEASMKKAKWTETTSSAAQIYQLLLLVPIEYLSKSLRADLVKRASIADIVLHNNGKRTDGLCQVATSIRLFLHRACEAVGSPDKSNDSARFVYHLVNSSLACQSADENYLAASLNLIEVFLKEAARTASKGNDTMLLENLDLFTNEAIQESASNGFLLPTFSRLVRVLVGHKYTRYECHCFGWIQWFNGASFSEGVQQKLKGMFSYQRSFILPHVSATTLNQDTLSAWRCISCLGSWLNARGEQWSGIGRQLVQKIAKTSGVPDQTRIDVIAILLQEVHSAKGDALLVQWELVLATYVTTYSGLTSSAQHEVDDILGRYSKNMATEEYSLVLDMISSALSRDWPTLLVLPDIIQFANVLQGEHPQGTLKPIQNFVTNVIHSFLMYDVYHSGPQALRLRVLEFISKFCSEKPSFIRSNDASAILTLLSKLLHPAAAHDETTALDVFHSTITILNSMIRLRRDLVATIIPHLSMVLRQLLSALRSCRPNLGAKQTRLVMNTLPRWITATAPLGVDEAKALSRLLEILTVKTLIRTHGAAAKAQTQKATSLAKPFSKHSAYVLKAYIEALNDPLCIVPLDVRKELKPGLYALCSMISEHARDAVMVSGLDAGGKAILKSLWREYEKQRYAGQG